MDSKQCETSEITALNNANVTSSNSNLFPVKDNDATKDDAPINETMTDKKTLDHRYIIKNCFETCSLKLCQCYDAGTFIKNPLVSEPKCIICFEKCCGNKPLCACSCCDGRLYKNNLREPQCTFCTCCDTLCACIFGNRWDPDNSGCDQCCCWCTCCENNYLSRRNCRFCNLEPGRSADNPWTLKCGKYKCCSFNGECTLCFINFCECANERHSICCRVVLLCGK